MISSLRKLPQHSKSVYEPCVIDGEVCSSNIDLFVVSRNHWLWAVNDGASAVGVGECVLLHASVLRAQISQVAPSAGTCKHISLSYYRVDTAHFITSCLCMSPAINRGLVVCERVKWQMQPAIDFEFE